MAKKLEKVFDLWWIHIKSSWKKGNNGKLLAAFELSIIPLIILSFFIWLFSGLPPTEIVQQPQKISVQVTPKPTPIPTPVPTPTPEPKISTEDFIKIATDPESAKSERQEMLNQITALVNLKNSLVSRYNYCRKHGIRGDNAQEWGRWSHEWNNSLKEFEKSLSVFCFVDEHGVYRGKWKETFFSLKMAVSELFILWSQYNAELSGRHGDIAHFKKSVNQKIKEARNGLQLK